MYSYDRTAKAKKKPLVKENRYVEYDEETEYWSIFGDKTGFCFGQYNSEEEAEKALADMR